MNNEEMQDALTKLEARHSEMMKQHIEWLRAHELATIEARERGKAMDASIAALDSAIREVTRRNSEK